MPHAGSSISRPVQAGCLTFMIGYAFLLERSLCFSHHPVLGIGKQHHRDSRIIDFMFFGLFQIRDDVFRGDMGFKIRHTGKLYGCRAIADRIDV